MEIYIYVIVSGVVGVLLGLAIDRFMLRRMLKQQEEEAREKAKFIIKEAEIEAEDRQRKKDLQGKERYLKMKNEFEQKAAKKKQQIQENERKVKQKDKQLRQLREDLGRKEAQLKEENQQLDQEKDTVRTKREELEKMRQNQLARLEKIASLSAEEAKAEIMDVVKQEAELKASGMIREIVDNAKQSATKQATKIVLETIQRTATETTIDNCVSVFNIEHDDIKGKIIGREGRNIRALEAATGVEIIVDDTPEAIIISGFDPVRREVARISMHRLVKDGRIHPARIEEVVGKTRKAMEEEIKEIGEKAVIDLGIHGLHPQLIKMVGRMRFRSSYGQNLLQHSREVANLCATMAAEMKLNPKLAKRAGLLHDIGKVPKEQSELPHALLGMEMAKKYGEKEVVCNAIGAHHDEIEMTSMLSPVIQACDAISGARPGARREIMESYIQRLKDLENLAISFDGVNKCYAIQAGRELRVMVDAEQVSDDSAGNLSLQIADKIEKEMQYPGQIKVTVIREMRSVNFAK